MKNGFLAGLGTAVAVAGLALAAAPGRRRGLARLPAPPPPHAGWRQPQLGRLSAGLRAGYRSEPDRWPPAATPSSRC